MQHNTYIKKTTHNIRTATNRPALTMNTPIPSFSGILNLVTMHKKFTKGPACMQQDMLIHQTVHIIDKKT